MLLATWDGDLARAAVAAGAASHRRQHSGDKCRPVVAQVDPLRAGFSRNEVAGSAPSRAEFDDLGGSADSSRLDAC